MPPSFDQIAFFARQRQQGSGRRSARQGEFAVRGFQPVASETERDALAHAGVLAQYGLPQPAFGRRFGKTQAQPAVHAAHDMLLALGVEIGGIQPKRMAVGDFHFGRGRARRRGDAPAFEQFRQTVAQARGQQRAVQIGEVATVARLAFG